MFARSWRNRHTRTFEGRVGDRTGSSPVDRTMPPGFGDRAGWFFCARFPQREAGCAGRSGGGCLLRPRMEAADEAILRSVPLGWRGVATRRGCGRGGPAERAVGMAWVATRRGCGRGDPAERAAWAHRVVVCRAQWASRLDGGYWRAVGEGRTVCARMAKARPAFVGRFGTCPRAGCASSASAVGRVYRVNTRFAMVKSMVSEAASTMVVMIGLAISAGSR